MNTLLAKPWFAALPVCAVVVSAVLVRYRGTRGFFDWLVAENHPVELATFAFLFLGSGIGLALARRLRRRDLLASVFFFIFSAGLFVVAMEEIAWGQQFLSFETPAWVLAWNAQKEFTLHNFEKLQGHSEFFRLAFAVPGLLAYAVCRRGVLRRLRPSLGLLPWLVVITVLAGIDGYADYYPTPTFVNDFTARFSEVVELMIGVVGFLYVLDQNEKFRPCTRPLELS